MVPRLRHGYRIAVQGDHVTPSFRLLPILALLTACGGSDEKGADTGSLDTATDTGAPAAIDWYTTGDDLVPAGAIGVQVSGSCPAIGADGSGTVWGTGTYTDDSSVCAAAVHDGRVTTAGGDFTLETRDGLTAYTASTANGVTTEEYGEWDRSFVFLPE
jgi:hypothetical protein